MKYFPEDTIFDPRNLDTEHLQSDMDFYHDLHQWYSHSAVMNGDEASKRMAIKAYSISQTLKAILCLCADSSRDQGLYNQILDDLCPIKRTETVTTYEFTANTDE